MNQYFSNLLFLIPILPFVTAVLISLIPEKHKKLSGYLAVFSILAGLLITVSLESITLPWHLNPAVKSLAIHKDWIPDLNIFLRLSVDGFSGWMILLTLCSTLTAVAFILLTRQPVNQLFSVLLCLSSATGVFMAKDVFSFIFAWGLWLIIPFTLKPQSRKSQRKQSSGYTKFFAFHLLSTLLIGAGFCMFFFSSAKSTGIQSLDITSMSQYSLSLYHQKIVLMLLFAGFAIRMPLFPLHGWLADSLDEMPAGTSAILLATGLATGTYSLINFCLPLCTDLILKTDRYFIFIAMVSMVYGSLVALMNPHILQRLGFTCLAYSGFVLMGVFSLNSTSLTGAALVATNFIITIPILILCTGWIATKAESVLLQDLGGIWRQSPLVAGIFLVASMAFVGIPGLCLFPGVFLVIGGTLLSQPAWATVAIADFLILATGMLWMFQQIFTGSSASTEDKFEPYSDTTPGRVMIPLTALIIWFGFFPQYTIHSLKTPIEKVNQHIKSHRIFNIEESSTPEMKLLFPKTPPRKQ